MRIIISTFGNNGDIGDQEKPIYSSQASELLHPAAGMQLSRDGSQGPSSLS